nr:hypothetical protein [Alloacidobacterium dinghuense]
MSSGMLGQLDGTWNNIGLWEIGHRIAVGLEEHKDLLAIGNPSSGETDAHAAT